MIFPLRDHEMSGNGNGLWKILSLDNPRPRSSPSWETCPRTLNAGGVTACRGGWRVLKDLQVIEHLSWSRQLLEISQLLERDVDNQVTSAADMHDENPAVAFAALSLNPLLA